MILELVSWKQEGGVSYCDDTEVCKKTATFDGFFFFYTFNLI